jgi:hypothetical protein
MKCYSQEMKVMRKPEMAPAAAKQLTVVKFGMRPGVYAVSIAETLVTLFQYGSRDRLMSS